MGYLYIIRNKVNDKFYLGSTNNYHKRKINHFSQLRCDKHHSIHLQRAYDKYGEDNFEFIIIETCFNHLEREQELLDIINLRKDTYNISSDATGGNRKPRYKEENSNWRGGKTFCKCGTRINSNTKTCIKCQDKTGKNNPFYGKTHTKETKLKLSKQKMGKYKGNQQKSVLIDNIEYESVSYAARQLNVCAATIIHRIKSKNKKYNEYFYKEKL